MFKLQSSWEWNLPVPKGDNSPTLILSGSRLTWLQVSSTEAQLKGEQPDFPYESPNVASRLRFQGQLPCGSHYAAPTLLGMDGLPTYRHNGLSTYSYPAVRYYSASSYGDYSDDNVDYSGVPGAAYPMLASEHLAMPSGTIYNTSGTSRGWTSATQLPKTNSVYLDQDPSYAHQQYHTTAFPLRSAVSHESKHGLSLGGMITSLPSSITGADRPVLPYPSAPRHPQVPLLRSSESMSALQGPQNSRNMDSISSYSDTLMTSGMMKALNHNSVTENSSISNPYLSSNAETLPSSQMSYSSQPLPSHQHNDIYTPTSTDSSPIYTITSSAEGSRSSEDLRYCPSSSSKRVSISQGPERTGSISDYSPKLSNGRVYEPHLTSQNYFPAPPMATGTQSMELPTHRRSSGIQASWSPFAAHVFHILFYPPTLFLVT